MAGTVRGEASGINPAAQLVEGDGDVDVLVRVDAHHDSTPSRIALCLPAGAPPVVLLFGAPPRQT